MSHPDPHAGRWEADTPSTERDGNVTAAITL